MPPRILKAAYKRAAEIPVYTAIQRRVVGGGPVGERLLIRAGLTGLTTHHGVLAVSALFGCLTGFVVYAMFLANLYLAALMAWRRWV